MRPANPNAFTGNPLDRAAAARKDEAWVEAQRRHPRAELILFHGHELLHERLEGRSRLLPLTLDALEAVGGPEPVLLGLRGEVPVWAADAGDLASPPFGDLGAYGDLRSLAPFLPPDELAIAGQAAWLLSWHGRHRFCARDSGETISVEGGGKRVNPVTGAEHFPRTDPVAIVLPIHEEAVCLGRGPHFPPGMMSAFAGFMEPGESLEECAARELAEETGLIAEEVSYVFSQPWPFPSSLMVGFFAAVSDRTLRLDPEEIAEARWLERSEVRALLAGGGPEDVFLPPPFAIAHQLLRRWAL
jgi:NAD+ diphosphatase